MSLNPLPSELEANDQALAEVGLPAAPGCSLSADFLSPETFAPDLCASLEGIGCPAAPVLKDRLQFESLLAELSAAFVHLPADQVDSQVESALRGLVEFLGLDRGSLAELLPEGNRLVITHSYHRPGVPPNPPMILDEHLPWYTRAIYRGQALRLPTLPDDLPPEAAAEREYCLSVGLKSHVMIPLRVTGSVVGAIGFASFRGRREWPDDLIRRLRLVGEIFSNAVARKRADEALRAKERSLRQTREGLRRLTAQLLHAQEEERRRVAREMHDDWSQRLAVLGIDAARLEAHLGTPEAALPLLHAMRDQLVALAEDVHALSRQLHPSILDDLGLAEALRSECAAFERREGVRIVYEAGPVPAGLPKDVALCVYRVAQEALRNLVKHAAVRAASVTLTGVGPDLLLRVRDEGVGFDPSAARPAPGLGLCGMEERARLVRGELAVTSRPGEGTTVELRVPPGSTDP